MHGSTVFYLAVNAAFVLTCLVFAVRGERPLRGMWLIEAGAFAGLFLVVWLANPAMTVGIVAYFIPDAALAALALWWAIGTGRDGRWSGWAIGAVALTWGGLLIAVAAGHHDRQAGVTDADRDRALLGQRVDQAYHHVIYHEVDHPPTLADDTGATGWASAGRIERSVFGPSTLTMVVNGAAGCEPSLVLVDDQGPSLDVLVVFERGIFLSPSPAPSSPGPSRPCAPPVPGNLMNSGLRSEEVSVQIDLPTATHATTVHDASQP